jgi:hypothetical protein
MKKRQRLKLLKKFSAANAVPSAAPPSLDEENCTTLAVEVWRLRRCASALPQQVNNGSISVSIDRLEELLRRMELEVHDPLGETYNEGMTLAVRLFEKTRTLPDGIMRIAETISPTIYRKGRMLQPGTVIVEVGDSEA